MPNLAKRYLVDHGRKFRLKDWDPKDTAHFESEKHGEEMLTRGIERLVELQEKLYAQNQWAVLVIFQAMDAAGKDGAIKHVMSGVNPQGCQVYSFKQPSVEELDHDFLWRTAKYVPEQGRIGIFNRSYYEEVLIVRVHSELLRREHLPPSLVSKSIWKERFEDINTFERHLNRNGVAILKFFLNISKAEQKKRFLKRLNDPARYWKFSIGDLSERERWNDYMHAYQEMIENTATPHAPWYVVPADNKWFTRLVVAEAIIGAIEELKPAYPKVDPARLKELTAARAALETGRRIK
ncbi:MAG: polyphosphate kinase 2 family protein [Candidatus Binatus sp.]|uniref:polyphosphate kinase 2 family protein n=1 Tax=Candidatus Binatus sp. TaxID=2811406 RepID=UPI00271DF8A8|nr:polyphosphate kinase 2 family protein [Candidatus Binatus sp.]MDO8433443.1 polyphosphate kinase 2 family protein [Candidatus Binatus sp.]